jgi:hypothetical protein
LVFCFYMELDVLPNDETWYGVGLFAEPGCTGL